MGIPVSKWKVNSVTVIVKKTNSNQSDLIKSEEKSNIEDFDHGSRDYNRLKFIDENCSELDKDDIDSGNASISSDQQESSSIESLEHRPVIHRKWNTVSFRSNTMKRYSTEPILNNNGSQIKRLISKLTTGDLIEIRCVCNCVRANQLRASINHRQRQRFRRTLQRQSFHQTSTSKNVWRQSLIEERSATQTPTSSSIDHQCTDQFHYVFVHKVSDSKSNAVNNVWCYHVRPYQRVATGLLLLDDDRHLGVIKYENLETIIGHFLAEMEERHWQSGGGHNRQPKLSVHYEIRNQEKLSQQILNQTLNATPDAERVASFLSSITDSHVRYHRSTLNSEHYATFWKYGIGWSTWANGRADILRTLQQFVQSLSQVNSGLVVGGGECQLDQTSLIVQCFGLHSAKLCDSVFEWIQSQVVIPKPPSTTTGC